MFNISVRVSEYNRLKQKLSKKGVQLCIDSRFTSEGKQFVDVIVGNSEQRYSKKLSAYVSSLVSA